MRFIHTEVIKKVKWWQPIHLISFGLGSGLLRPASGTWGSLMGVVLAYLCFWLGFDTYQHYGSATVLIAIVGVFACHYTTKALGEHDHNAIVIDEILGIFFLYAVAFFLLIDVFNVEVSLSIFNLYSVAIFVLFRLFDVWKPLYIRTIDEKMQNAYGIMLDDWLAAVYASLFLGLFGCVLHKTDWLSFLI